MPFDVDRFEVTGQTVPVQQGVRVENGGAVQASVSRDGHLVYVPAEAAIGTQLVWVDRDGDVASVLDERRRVFFGPRLSPAGDQVAVAVQDSVGSETDIWIREVESGAWRRLTTAGASSPIWTPDGTQIAFASESDGAFFIQRVAADGSGGLETVVSSEHPLAPEAWSLDGDQVIFREDSPNSNVYVADVGGVENKTPLLASDFQEHSVALSHDGRWLAYVSDQSGSQEVHVRSLEAPGAEHVVSTAGGVEPVWGPNDTELFFRASETGPLMVASVRTEPFRILGREPLFEAGSFWSAIARAQYDVHPDTQLFLMLNMRQAQGTGSSVHVVVNWFEELTRLVPPN